MLKKKRGVIDFVVIFIESNLTWEEGTSAEELPRLGGPVALCESLSSLMLDVRGHSYCGLYYP